MIYRSGFVLFAGDKEAHATEARAYLARYGLQQDSVKMVARGTDLLIITKKEVTLVEAVRDERVEGGAAGPVTPGIQALP